MCGHDPAGSHPNGHFRNLDLRSGLRPGQQNFAVLCQRAGDREFQHRGRLVCERRRRRQLYRWHDNLKRPLHGAVRSSLSGDRGRQGHQRRGPNKIGDREHSHHAATPDYNFRIRSLRFGIRPGE
jgi:hypothetical protein